MTRKQRLIAAAAYNEQRESNIELTKRILATLEGKQAANPSWGQVGSQEAYNEQLSALSDMMHGEGEYK